MHRARHVQFDSPHFALLLILCYPGVAQKGLGTALLFFSTEDRVTIATLCTVLGNRKRSSRCLRTDHAARNHTTSPPFPTAHLLCSFFKPRLETRYDAALSAHGRCPSAPCAVSSATPSLCRRADLPTTTRQGIAATYTFPRPISKTPSTPCCCLLTLETSLCAPPLPPHEQDCTVAPLTTEQAAASFLRSNCKRARRVT